MKIGILDCDTLRATLQPQFGRQYSSMFIPALQAVHDAPEPLQFATWSALEGELPQDVRSCDAWLITGSKHDAFADVPWVEALRTWIRTAHAARIPLVGICFGHQAIAAALGGQVGRAAVGWGVGRAAYPIRERKGWMPQDLTSIDVLNVHRDQVQALPQDSTLLAGSPFCPNYSYQTGEHILCIQGHPEFSKPYQRQLLEILRPELGQARYQAALASLEQEINSPLVLKAMLNFMQTGAAAKI